MRFILHNPHTLWYKNTLGSFITKTKAVDKYEPIFDYLYFQKTKKVFVYLDNTSFSSSSNTLFESIKVRLYFYIWLAINKLNPLRFCVITNMEKLTNEDIFMTFIYENFTNINGEFSVPREPIIKEFKRTKAFKVVHLSHYGYNTGVGSNNCKEAEIDLFIAENNLAKNSVFFQQHFPWYKKDVYVLPFIPQKRFTKIQPFAERINKAIAMGTITHPMTDSNYVSFFKNEMLQPMRLEIFNKAKDLEKQIDSFISKADENAIQLETIESQFLAKIKKHINHIKIVLSIFLSLFKKNKTLYFSKKERQYFKWNIVEKYNNYKMFINPEEAIGLPGIGFVEGMACGCAYIGLRDPMYNEIGLIDKIHYIGYNGTVKDLKEKIEYYQNNPKELEEIAHTGYEFVIQKLNIDVVCSKFLNDITNFCNNKKETHR